MFPSLYVCVCTHVYARVCMYIPVFLHVFAHMYSWQKRKKSDRQLISAESSGFNLSEQGLNKCW